MLFNFNLVQRALVLEDYAPALRREGGVVRRKKGARSMGEEKKEGKNNNKMTGKINMKKKEENKHKNKKNVS